MIINPFWFKAPSGGGGGPPSTSQWTWLRSDEAYSDTACTTLQTTDNGSVAGLKDKSGNSRDLIQATGANQPTYQTNEINSLPIIRFDGTNDEIILNSITLNQSFTVYLVYKPVSWGAGSRDVLTFSTTSNGVRFQHASSLMQLWPGTTAITDTEHATGSFYLFAGKFSNTSSQQKTDNNATVTGGSGTGSGSYVCLGSGNAQQESQIDVAELIIYNTSHTFTSGDGLLVRQYLDTRYNLLLGI